MARRKGERPFDYEYKPGEELVLRFRRPVIDVIPDEVSDHLRAAVKELLLALRGFLEVAIEGMEEREQRRATRRRAIKVE